MVMTGWLEGSLSTASCNRAHVDNLIDNMVYIHGYIRASHMLHAYLDSGSIIAHIIRRCYDMQRYLLAYI